MLNRTTLAKATYSKSCIFPAARIHLLVYFQLHLFTFLYIFSCNRWGHLAKVCTRAYGDYRRSPPRRRSRSRSPRRRNRSRSRSPRRRSRSRSPRRSTSRDRSRGRSRDRSRSKRRSRSRSRSRSRDRGARR